jgi:hypothetical protein
MTGFPRLLIASSVVAFTFAATAFRVPKLSTASGGSVAPAGRMLVPRSGHTATLRPDGARPHGRRHATQSGFLQIR